MRTLSARANCRRANCRRRRSAKARNRGRWIAGEIEHERAAGGGQAVQHQQRDRLPPGALRTELIPPLVRSAVTHSGLDCGALSHRGQLTDVGRRATAHLCASHCSGSRDRANWIASCRLTLRYTSPRSEVWAYPPVMASTPPTSIVPIVVIEAKKS
jgi:hypothetical protein